MKYEMFGTVSGIVLSYNKKDLTCYVSYTCDSKTTKDEMLVLISEDNQPKIGAKVKITVEIEEA